jgi:RNA polymerase primary sigma factor
LRDAARTVTSLDRPVGEDGGTALGDLIPDQEALPGEEVFLRMREQIVRDTVAELPNPERDVLRRRYGLSGSPEPQTLAHIGRELGLSSERVRQIEERGLQALALRRELQSLAEAA